jgi:hypothetical protein
MTTKTHYGGEIIAAEIVRSKHGKAQAAADHQSSTQLALASHTSAAP